MKWLKQVIGYFADAVILFCAVQVCCLIVDVIGFSGMENDGLVALGTQKIPAGISILAMGSLVADHIGALCVKAFLYQLALIVCLIFRIACAPRVKDGSRA